MDYEFYEFVLTNQYLLDPTDNPPNENDIKYRDYSELLLQAMEHGAGYRVEFENILYVAPTPLIKQDERQRFHSELVPAIRWKNAEEFYYLRGLHFEKEEWEKITGENLTARDVLEIQDTDKRSIAMAYLGAQEMIKGLNGELVHTGEKGNKLYKCKNFMGAGSTEYGLLMKDASSDREFFQFVDWRADKHNPTQLGYKVRKNADHATAYMFRDADGDPLPIEDYMNLLYEA